jgi:hypothetical protein
MPFWLIGLGRVVWYIGLMPLACAHFWLCIVGGSKRHIEFLAGEFGTVAAVGILTSLVWFVGMARLLGLWSPT